MITVEVLDERGWGWALLGMSLSYNSPWGRMPDRARMLAVKDGGHNKFLESIVVWLDIRTSRDVWQQFDTYRVGVTKQSESTMHTLMRRHVTQEDFSMRMHPASLDVVNYYIDQGDLVRAKAHLPEGFMQRRIVCTNYKSLRNLYQQRRRHRHPAWRELCQALRVQLKHGEYLERKGKANERQATD